MKLLVPKLVLLYGGIKSGAIADLSDRLLTGFTNLLQIVIGDKLVSALFVSIQQRCLDTMIPN